MNTNTEIEVQAQTAVDLLPYIPKALELNTNSVTKATEAGQAILDTIEAEGMTPELYEAAQAMVAKISLTYKNCYDRRMPAFQAVDEFRSKFTALEKQIDPKVKDSIAAKIQKKLDDHVAELARQEEIRKQQAARKLAMDQERITIKNNIDALLVQHVNGYIADAKKYFNGIFETITLDTLEKDKANLSTPALPYKETHFNSFAPKVTAIYHTQEDIAGIITECKEGKLISFSVEVIKEIETFKRDLIDKIPGKVNELQAAAKAKAEKEAADKAAAEAKTEQAKADALIAQAKAEEDQRRLAQETSDRQKAEQERLAKEKADADLKAQADAQAAAAVQQTQTLFDAQVTAHQSAQEVPQAKEGYQITILHPSGYLPIVMFYFEKEGLQKLPEELEKKTLKQMVAFAEKRALKDDKEKIVNQYITYTPTYKAVVKK